MRATVLLIAGYAAATPCAGTLQYRIATSPQAGGCPAGWTEMSGATSDECRAVHTRLQTDTTGFDTCPQCPTRDFFEDGCHVARLRGCWTNNFNIMHVSQTCPDTNVGTIGSYYICEQCTPTDQPTTAPTEAPCAGMLQYRIATSPQAGGCPAGWTEMSDASADECRAVHTRLQTDTTGFDTCPQCPTRNFFVDGCHVGRLRGCWTNNFNIMQVPTTCPDNNVGNSGTYYICKQCLVFQVDQPTSTPTDGATDPPTSTPTNSPVATPIINCYGSTSHNAGGCICSMSGSMPCVQPALVRGGQCSQSDPCLAYDTSASCPSSQNCRWETASYMSSYCPSVSPCASDTPTNSPTNAATDPPTSTPTYNNANAPTAANQGGVNGDPFTIDQNGQKRQFYLPLGEYTKLLKCDSMELSGATIGSGIVGDVQQWFSSFRVSHNGQEVLLVSVVNGSSLLEGVMPEDTGDVDVTVSDEKALASFQDHVKESLRNVKKEAAKVRHAGEELRLSPGGGKLMSRAEFLAIYGGSAEWEAAKSVNPVAKLTTLRIITTSDIDTTGEYHLAQNKVNLTVVQNTQRLGKGYAEHIDVNTGSVEMRIRTAVAQKLTAKAEQIRKLHLDLDFKKMDSTSCTGTLPEIWGILPMSKATAKLLQH